MVKSGTGRRKKFEAKTDSRVISKRYEDTKDLAVKKQKAYFDEAEITESKIKAIMPGVSVMLIPYYIIFAKECQKVMKRHTGEAAAREICISANKWHSRGLLAEHLNTISSYYAKISCIPIIICEVARFDAGKFDVNCFG